MSIGEKIKQLRKTNKLTQQELAEKLYISFQSVSNWERGVAHPTTEMMLHIIENFQLPMAFFIDEPFDSKEEKLILSSFVKSMYHSRDEAPSLENIQALSGLSAEQITSYFPSYDDLVYAIIHQVDQNIKMRVADRLATNDDVMAVFIDDMAPLLYSKKNELHILYTRPYIKGVWMQFIKSKYKSILLQHTLNESSYNDNLATEYLIETLMGFISVWMSQTEPESLEQFQNRIKYLANNNLSSWQY